MLPRVEVDNLMAEGHVADGYRVLLTAKQRALEVEANFEPCAEELEGPLGWGD